MKVAFRLGTAVAALLCACSLDASNKIACDTVADCDRGYTCDSNRCVRETDGGTAGGGRGGNGGSGNVGIFDAGPPPPMCPTSGVTACPSADTGIRCEETFCGGRLWQNVTMPSILVPYQIEDPQVMFSPSHRAAIRASAAAWTRASGGFVTFKECTLSCTGRFVSVVPGDGDGIADPEALNELFLPMPAAGRVSPHRIAHQWGHAVGLAHTYERADRDRYVRFDPEIWCPSDGSGLPPRCAAGPAGPPGLPAVTTGTFGVFDGKSKMNALRNEGICGEDEPDEDSGEPTIGDLSAVAELFFGPTHGWSPFRPIGRSVSPGQPLDYQLAPGVDPVGSPAIAAAEQTYASPEIFVRGRDDRIYTTTRKDPATTDWWDWAPIADADDVDGDPAVVFSELTTPETLFLAVRSRSDGDIRLRARRGGAWGGWTSLAAPPSGAASAPALASESPDSLAVLVRGGDGLIYWLACTDARDDCAASAARPNAWSALPPPSSGIFVGKPSAVWLINNTGLTVAAVRDDRVALLTTSVNRGASAWAPIDTVNDQLAPDDPDPGIAITIAASPGDVVFFARNQQRLLVSDTTQLKFFPIGGVLASPPAAVGIYHGDIRTDVAAIIEDHGRPGVWWRFRDSAYVAPCHYNRPGTCGVCGLP